MLYLALAAVIRLALILFFERIFFPNPKFKVYTRIGIFSCVIFYIALLFRSIFQCSPLQKVWDPLLPGHCISQAVGSYTTGIFNIISDLYILILPMPCIWALNLDIGRKLRIMAVFSVGLVYDLPMPSSLDTGAHTSHRRAFTASIVRLINTVQTVNDPDITWSRSPLILWTYVLSATLNRCDSTT